MIETFKAVIDTLSTPTISFTILTVLALFLFPPTDWFDKINRKLGIWKWEFGNGEVEYGLLKEENSGLPKRGNQKPISF